MLRRNNFWISLICILLAGLLAYVMYWFQLRQIEVQAAVQVVVPKHFIAAGTLITSDMIGYRSLVKSAYDESMLTTTSEVIGKEAVIPLGWNEPVLAWKLNHLHLLPENGQSTFQIPKEYVLSISSGIRAGDRVAIYVSGGQAPNRRLFSSSVVVASVKSTAYTEIEDVEQAHLLSKVRNNEEMMYVTRRHASAPIDHINLNLTEAQWLEIDRLCREGEAKLVIAFTGDYIISEENQDKETREG